VVVAVAAADPDSRVHTDQGAHAVPLDLERALLASWQLGGRGDEHRGGQHKQIVPERQPICTALTQTTDAVTASQGRSPGRPPQNGHSTPACQTDGLDGHLHVAGEGRGCGQTPRCPLPPSAIPIST
jgi:hypothetical protein